MDGHVSVEDLPFDDGNTRNRNGAHNKKQPRQHDPRVGCLILALLAYIVICTYTNLTIILYILCYSMGYTLMHNLVLSIEQFYFK